MTDKKETKQRKITRQSAKDKGRRLQSWACKKVSEITGFEWGSSGEDKPIESRPMGQHGTDVRMESQVIKLFPFSVECKYRETWSVPQWIQDTKENQIEGTDWLLIIKKNHLDPVVIMDAERFFEIYRKLIKDVK